MVHLKRLLKRLSVFGVMLGPDPPGTPEGFVWRGIVFFRDDQVHEAVWRGTLTAAKGAVVLKELGLRKGAA